MYAPERQIAILERAQHEGRVDVRELATELNVTPETIRRDLTMLQRRGRLRRVHGGAIPLDRIPTELTVPDRSVLLVEEKARIARAALAELPSGGSIVLDAGTTTLKLAELLPHELEIRVVTNSLQIATVLAARQNVKLHLLGGHIRDKTLATVGPWGQQELQHISADVVFIGINGITPEQGLTTPDLEEATTKTALIAAAQRTVVLADHTKFGRQDFGVVAKLDEVDTIITDSALDNSLFDEVVAAGPEVIRA